MDNIFPIEAKAFEIPMYRCVVSIAYNAEVYKRCQAYFEDEDEELYAGATRKYEEGSQYLVGVFDGTSSTLVHELAHAAFMILDHVGIPIETDGNNEAYCYLIGYLMEMADDVFYKEGNHGDIGAGEAGHN